MTRVPEKETTDWRAQRGDAVALRAWFLHHGDDGDAVVVGYLADDETATLTEYDEHLLVDPENVAPWHTADEWDAAQARIAELEALLRDAAPFLEASEAVWRELERLRREAGKPMGLEGSTELRIREREAWIDYDEQRCGPRLRGALGAAADPAQ